MKKIILLTIILISTIISAQELSLIKKAVSEINKEKVYSVIEIPNDYFVDEKNEVLDNGQSLEAYYKNNKLKKIVHFAGISYQNITTEYYIDKNRLIFVLEKKYLTQGENASLNMPKLISENRYYFKNDVIIKTIGQEKVDQDYIKTVKSFLNDLKKFKKN
ncbi:hypothetical protein [Frigoriflavimonas asaccharolytica]|uniref:Uncharacterized protein n=1 Tax=Frigoriflavimonas asaccharolytica TaxID=2735899 RepID=A0A8J8GAU0_9FLAO|nr:hypothetical protein [Frigoriflavimonas asaccharolytica]NRS92804.1 hypothetical protein [Frigoriflavimonas asaccharolytica]